MDEQWFIDSCGNSEALDEWTWSESLGDRKNDVLLEHWNSWITDDDIRFIAES
jgi:glucan 1,3-beta-glucosidase